MRNKIILRGLFYSLFLVIPAKSHNENFEIKALSAAFALSPSMIGISSKFLPEKSFFAIVGKYSVSKEFESKIRPILKELGLPNWETIPLKKKNNLTGMSSPAFAYKNGIWFEEAVCEKYDLEELKFLIGHEASHIIGKDAQNREDFLIIAPVAIYGGFQAIRYGYGYIYEKITGRSINSYIDSWHFDIATSCSSLACSGLLYLKNSRTQEMQRDTDSIKKLDCAEGAVKLFEKFKKECPYPKKPEFMLSHPSDDDRIANAKKYLKEDSKLIKIENQDTPDLKT